MQKKLLLIFAALLCCAFAYGNELPIHVTKLRFEGYKTLYSNVYLGDGDETDCKNLTPFEGTNIINWGDYSPDRGFRPVMALFGDPVAKWGLDFTCAEESYSINNTVVARATYKLIKNGTTYVDTYPRVSNLYVSLK